MTGPTAKAGRQLAAHWRESGPLGSAVLIAASASAMVLLPQAPIAAVAAGSSTIDVRWWDAAYLAVVLAGVAMLVTGREALVKSRPRGWRDPLVWAVALAGVCALSLIWAYANFGSSGLPEEILRVLRLAIALVLAWIVRAQFVREVSLRTPAIAGVTLLGCVVVSCAWAFVAWRTQSHVVGARSFAVTRAGGPFGNFYADGTGDSGWAAQGSPNTLGFLAAATVGVAVTAVAVALRRGLWWRAGMAAAVVVVTTAGLVATHSRESLVAAVAAVLVSGWASRGRLGQRAAGMLVLAVPVLAVAVVFAVPSLRDRTIATFTPGTFEHTTGPSARIDSWNLGLSWGTERFPLGYGIGTIEEHPRRFGQSTAENVFIQAYAQTGVAGAVALLVLVALAISAAYRQVVRSGTIEALLALSFFAALAVHGIFGNTLWDPLVLLSFGLALGMIRAPGRAVAPRRSPGRVVRQLARLREGLVDLPVKFYAGYVAGRIAPLLMLPVISRVLSVDDFGRFEVSLAILGAAVIVFDAGVGAAVVRFASRERVIGATLISSAVQVQLLAGIVAILAVAPVVALARPDGVSLTLLLVMVALFANVEGLAVLGGGLLRAEGRDGRYLAYSCTRFAVTIGGGSIGAAVAGPVGALLGLAVGGVAFAVDVLVRWARTRAPGDGELRARLARFGVPLIATSLSLWALGVSDRLFLDHMVAESAIAQYGVNYRLGNLTLVLLASPLMLAWLPIAQRAGTDELRARLRQWTRAFVVVSVLSSVAICAVAPFAIPFAFGAQYHADLLVVAGVATSGLFGGLSLLAATPLLVGESTAPMARVAVATVVFNLIANAILITSLKVHGAALATAASFGFSWFATLVAARRAGGMEHIVARRAELERAERLGEAAVT